MAKMTSGVALAALIPLLINTSAFAVEAAVLPAGDPVPVIDAFDQTLLSVMMNAEQLGYEGRYKNLEPAIKRTFNVPLMTKIVVGTKWNDWSQDQRDHVTDAFGRFIIATYARRFDGYSGEKFVIDAERPTNGGVLVVTRLTRPADPPITLTYLTRQNGEGTPQVVDVFLTGTISELATRRSEFGAVLQRNGYDGLLATLEKKATNQGGP
jgi:phospholipid transport system substrate-binding protein